MSINSIGIYWYILLGNSKYCKYLVGAFTQPLQKNMTNWIISPKIGVKRTNIWSHQGVMARICWSLLEERPSSPFTRNKVRFGLKNARVQPQFQNGVVWSRYTVILIFIPSHLLRLASCGPSLPLTIIFTNTISHFHPPSMLCFMFRAKRQLPLWTEFNAALNKIVLLCRDSWNARNNGQKLHASWQDLHIYQFKPMHGIKNPGWTLLHQRM